MQLNQLARTTFSGHESFPLRFGWLAKVARHLPGQPALFTLETAPTLLGVGKNMVNSMRYWCEALGFIAHRTQRGEMELTVLAQQLLSPSGWDPYLEDPATLWLLHWQLMHHPERATLAHLMFTQFPAERFDKEQVLIWLERGIRDLPQVRATSRSIERDFDVFVRMYLPVRTLRGQYSEDSFDSPLLGLGLLRRHSRQQYEFARGDQPSLPLSVLAYALMQYWQRTAPLQNTVALERLLHDPGSPGAAFKLTESAFIDRLLKLAPTLGLNYDDTAGVRVISRSASWNESDMLFQLEAYYVHTVTSSTLSAVRA